MDQETRTTAGQVMGIIGIVLAVISLILAFIPCIGIVAFLPAGIAIIFSVVSIVQATNGYGSKSLGIGALVVSIISVLVAAIWLSIIASSGNGSTKIEAFSKEFSREFRRGIKDGFEDEDHATIRVESDSLEKTLRELEGDLKSIKITIDDKPSKNGKKGKKKVATITIESDSAKVHVEANE